MKKILWIDKKKMRFLILILPLSGFFSSSSFAATAAHTSSTTSLPAYTNKGTSSISSNIAAENISTGTGILQDYIEKQFGIKNNHGIHFGGAWMGDANDVFSTGVHDAKKWTFNSLLLLNMTIDTQKLMGLNGGLFGVQFLQFNGQDTNGQAGTIQGYNSLPGPKPLSRSELYQLWYRQSLFSNKLIIRIGKSVPTYDFNNELKPVPLSRDDINIPSVSGLLFTPLFVNTSMLGVIPGYYNSAYGITMTVAPIKQWYLSYGVYDGDLARGIQTGLHDAPSFDGSYFHIAETGTAWLLGKNNKPGNFSAGVWHQTGPIAGSPTVFEHGATGYYLFGSQRLWYRHPEIDNSGISMYYQYGKNNSDALPMTQYIGAGLTAFGLIPRRHDDSMGVGTAFSWLNQHSFNRSTELMFQAYYQAKIINAVYLEPALSYIPTPGGGSNLKAAWAGTLRAIVLF